MIGLIGKKIGMTQVFDDQGRQVPVTVLEVGPCHVTELRTSEKNGYKAVQIGYGKTKEKALNKAKLGHLKKAKAEPVRLIKEIRTEDIDGVQIGSKVAVDNFEAGDYVDVEAVSVGRGFQGVVKRHRFKGALTMSHGDMSGRRPGSIGASSFPSRVVKGMRMAGQMGNKTISIQNLKVLKVDQENNLLVLNGSVPGIEGSFLVVRTSLKRGARRKWKVQGTAEGGKKEAPAQASQEPASTESDSEAKS
jgi:large subunit ribosomal protein L3